MSSVSCSPAPVHAISICQESFNDLKKIFTFDRNKNNLYNNALHFIPLSAGKEWHWEWFYNLDQSVFLQKTLTLTYIRFHSIYFLLLIFPFLTWECKLLAVKMCRFPPALPVATRHVPIPREIKFFVTRVGKKWCVHRYFKNKWPLISTFHHHFKLIHQLKGYGNPKRCTLNNVQWTLLSKTIWVLEFRKQGLSPS